MQPVLRSDDEWVSSEKSQYIQFNQALYVLVFVLSQCVYETDLSLSARCGIGVLSTDVCLVHVWDCSLGRRPSRPEAELFDGGGDLETMYRGRNSRGARRG